MNERLEALKHRLLTRGYIRASCESRQFAFFRHKWSISLVHHFFSLTSDVYLCACLCVCVCARAYWSDPILGDRQQKGGWWGWKERAWSSMGAGSWTLLWQKSLARLCGRGEKEGRSPAQQICVLAVKATNWVVAANQQLNFMNDWRFHI